ncbi:hypothetical protein POM88_012768 [Heracleum sosnowskyi]|uniref:Uncharacterized protein n=1 Tax=Heracleum sosnowskyi TaxID=360622 RepID=A0AAD8N2L6_9APIA|nr:hypothetical protein POM88_012762 [Heracleum sosnowskyi]KAK1393712.1 hypothetical protein POM88_012768 [Heracleum sosnowskyi]
MANIKVYFCFEATTNIQGQHVYSIYSTELNDLMRKGAYKKPTFTLERVIPGFLNMGCGVFGSKIVLAGGHIQVGGLEVHNHDLITYDMATKLVSRNDFPPMSQRKLRPLVIQLYNKLYVFDTSDYVVENSFQTYAPNENLPSPYLHPNSPYSWKGSFSGRTPFSWFACGKSICLTGPLENNSLVHHTDQYISDFFPCFKGLLPFRGMAITYYQQGFPDVVVISFSHGRVEGRRLSVASRYSLGDPVLLFETDPFQQPDGEMSHYFADCGGGIFSLTTFDNATIHVYMFKILRHKDQADGSLDLDLVSLILHEFDFSSFSTDSFTSFCVLGCLVPSTTDGCDKQFEESVLYSSTS